VPPGDREALARALAAVLHDHDLAESLHQAGTRRAADFSMRELADEYVRIYRELIAERAAAVRPARWWRRLH
jgi:glycosyltransferase involved in cell wall biosynthesis